MNLDFPHGITKDNINSNHINYIYSIINMIHMINKIAISDNYIIKFISSFCPWKHKSINIFINFKCDIKLIYFMYVNINMFNMLVMFHINDRSFIKDIYSSFGFCLFLCVLMFIIFNIFNNINRFNFMNKIHIYVINLRYENKSKNNRLNNILINIKYFRNDR